MYRKANHFLEAARLIFDLAREETAKRSSHLRLKKLYVLGALLVEDHHKHVRETTKGAGNRSSALMGIMDIDGMDPTGGTRIEGQKIKIQKLGNLIQIIFSI